jgi:hypothetical protein
VGAERTTLEINNGALAPMFKANIAVIFVSDTPYIYTKPPPHMDIINVTIQYVHDFDQSGNPACN